MTLHYATTETTIGELLLVASPQGLLRVAFLSEEHGSVLVALAKQMGEPPIFSPDHLSDALRQFDEYFSGNRTRFDLALDLQLSTPFRRAVQEYLIRIPYGDTASYAEVASAVGKPKAVRTVGTACATNPLPVVLPCHRVVRSDGALGNYLGGLDAKRTLLALENRSST